MPEIPQELIGKIRQRDLQNIASRARDGKPLTEAQLRRLESSREQKPGVADAEKPIAEYCATIPELALQLGTTKKTIYLMRLQGLTLPQKTRKGYNVAEFKRRYAEFLTAREQIKMGRPATSGREHKIDLECQKLAVNIKIDDQRLAQAELETQRQRGAMIPLEDHTRALYDIRALYLSSLDQLVELVATKQRSKAIRADLQAAVATVRNRIAEMASHA